MTLTADQPMQAATLKSAIMIAPTQPKEKREMVIWRNPSFGPSVEKKATGNTPRALKMIITAMLSQKPIPNTGIAIAPRATVERTRLAESHIVKLSKMRTCERVAGDTRSIPCVSTPLPSSGMLTTSEAILPALLSPRTRRRMLVHHSAIYNAVLRKLKKNILSSFPEYEPSHFFQLFAALNNC